MPRRKIKMGLIGKASSRTRTFNGRKEGLQKKARELSKLCDVDVALVCAGGPGGGAAPDVWEFGGGAGVIDRYRRLPADKRAKHTHLAYLNAALAKEKRTLAKERQEGPKALAPPAQAALEGVDLEELLASIYAALLATAQRRRELGLPDSDGGGGGGVSGGGQAAAVPLVEQGALLPLAGDADLDGMEAWLDELTWHAAEPRPLDGSVAVQPASSGVFQYINGVEPRPLTASMAHPASGVPYTNGGGGTGNQYLQQIAGNGGENGHGQQTWDASYQLDNAVSCPDYGFQYSYSSCSSSDMSGYSQMLVPSNANAYDGCSYDQAMWGANESSCDAIMPAEYYHDPSLDFAGNPMYMPPEHSGIGNGDCFTGVSPIGRDGSSFMDDASGHGYGTQCLADYFQCPDATQQFGDEPLHYLSDVAQGIGYYDDLEAGSFGNGGSQQ
ncbi:unnamed protein product [Urochloa humidicola]